MNLPPHRKLQLAVLTILLTASAMLDASEPSDWQINGMASGNEDNSARTLFIRRANDASPNYPSQSYSSQSYSSQSYSNQSYPRQEFIEKATISLSQPESPATVQLPAEKNRHTGWLIAPYSESNPGRVGKLVIGLSVSRRW